MTNLIITINQHGITAIELYCGDDVKYVESFNNWNELLNTLSQYMNYYSYITIRAI